MRAHVDDFGPIEMLRFCQPFLVFARVRACMLDCLSVLACYHACLRLCVLAPVLSCLLPCLRACVLACVCVLLFLFSGPPEQVRPPGLKGRLGCIQSNPRASISFLFYLFLRFFLSIFAFALWARTIKNTNCITGPLALPFAHSLAPLTRSLAPHYLLRSRPPMRSLARSLRSLPRSWESE